MNFDWSRLPVVVQLLLLVCKARSQDWDINGIESMGSLGSGAGQFFYPYDLTFDNLTQRLYVADPNNDRVQYLTSSHTYGGEVSVNGFPIGLSSLNGVIYVTLANDNNLCSYGILNSTLIKCTKTSGSVTFDNPWGVHAYDNRVYVADYNNRKVEILSGNLSPVGSFPVDCKPRYVHADLSELYLTCDRSVLLIYNRFSGNKLREWTLPSGSGYGLTVNKANEVVLTHINDYVLVIQNAILKRIVGSSGSNLGYFRWPVGVDLLPNGHIAVVDNGNNRVQYFETY